MLKCWSEKAAQRPTFAELKSKFVKLLLQNSAYIQFSSYADTTTTDSPPGYDHLELPPPSVSVDPSSQTNSAAQTTSYTDTKSKPVAIRTLSAPLVEQIPSVDDDDVSSNFLNSYVETPMAIINPRFRVIGAEERDCNIEMSEEYDY